MSETVEFTIGEHTLILDAEDLERAAKYNWKINPNQKKGLSFACTIIDPKVGWLHKKWRGREWKQRKRKLIFLHRFLIGAPSDLAIVYLNGNELDYRKKNLKACTQADLNKIYNLTKVHDTADSNVRELHIESATRGLHKVKFDAEDWDIIKAYRWSVGFTPSRSGNQPLYAIAWGVFEGDPRHIRMHRLIKGSPPAKVVDHVDGETLDNRKSNLRICTQADNARNRRRITSGAEVPFKGVKKNKSIEARAIDGHPLNPYSAQINFNKKREHLGIYATAQEAAVVYDNRARELHGEFAKLNFPDGPSPEILEIVRKGQEVAAALRAERKKQPRQQKKAKGSISVHLGVGFEPKLKRPWVTKIRGVRLGSFTTEEEAARAYNKKAPEIYGPDAILNQL